MIRGNQGDGVRLSDTSTMEASVDDPLGIQIIDNSGFGVFCDDPPAVSQLVLFSPITVTGNTAGQVECRLSNP